MAAHSSSGARRSASSPILLILLFIFFGLYEPKFWRGANLINVLRNSSYLMIISAGQMLVLVIGGFDLSVGAVVALTSVAAGLVMADLYAAWPDAASLAIVIGLVVGLAVGSAIGVINGGHRGFPPGESLHGDAGGRCRSRSASRST